MSRFAWTIEGVAFAAVVGGVVIAYRLLQRRRVSKKRSPAHYSTAAPADVTPLDVRRKALIVKGGATDHAGEVCVCVAEGFDFNRTIFHNLTGLGREVIKSSVAVELFWADSAVARVTAAFARIPAAPAHNKALLDFMASDCNFAMEHADGSFMDHLQWCFEYGVAHYAEHSPRVLFLHSIMGVGTNVFPMGVEHVDRLQALLTAEEFKHIEAFPSFVRLLNRHAFTAELLANVGKLRQLKSITFHRVIDNKPLTLSAKDLWVQLNYHIVHLLDFLPASNWGALADGPLFQVFLALHKLMVASGELVATVDFDLKSGEQSAAGLPITLGGVIARALPAGVKKNMAIKAITKYSAQIGHSLDYELHWE
jgi:hypothetical protein